jgi:hypothetical protein
MARDEHPKLVSSGIDVLERESARVHGQKNGDAAHNDGQ